MNALLPKPVAQDAKTVTFDRAEWEAYLANASDLAASDRFQAQVQAVGMDEALRLSYTAAEAERIIDGASALAIWRQRAGLSQRALAAAAEISPSYLAEIEGGKKPGSAAALHRIAKVLRVPMEHLV